MSGLFKRTFGFLLKKIGIKTKKPVRAHLKQLI
jgi:hypothetical protein